MIMNMILPWDSFVRMNSMTGLAKHTHTQSLMG
jgi:hypothetical protein